VWSHLKEHIQKSEETSRSRLQKSFADMYDVTQTDVESQITKIAVNDDGVWRTKDDVRARQVQVDREAREAEDRRADQARWEAQKRREDEDRREAMAVETENKRENDEREKARREKEEHTRRIFWVILGCVAIFAIVAWLVSNIQFSLTMGAGGSLVLLIGAGAGGAQEEDNGNTWMQSVAKCVAQGMALLGGDVIPPWIYDLKVDELKSQLERRCLKKSGRKADLQKRLAEACRECQYVCY
jgi:cation transport ATPase